MSESKSIIDLCRLLPNSEPELRARALDFTRAVCVQVMGWQEVADVSEIPTERMSDTIYFEPFAGVVGDVSGNDVGSVLVYAGGDAYKFSPLVYIADAKAATNAMIGRGFGFELELFSSGKWFVNMSQSVPILQARSPLVAFTPLSMDSASATASTEELARSAACVLAAEALAKAAK